MTTRSREPIEILYRAGPNTGEARPHGVPATYKAGCGCDACRAAVAKDVRESYGRRVGKRRGRRELPDGVQHGTPEGYARGCSCQPCKTAEAERRRDYRARGQTEDTATEGT